MEERWTGRKWIRDFKERKGEKNRDFRIRETGNRVRKKIGIWSGGAGS